MQPVRRSARLAAKRGETPPVLSDMAAINRFESVMRPLLDANAIDRSSMSVIPILTAMYDHPDTRTVLSHPRLRTVVRGKLEEFRVSPSATPSVRLLTGALLHKYY
jgi:hypothetical protein